MEGGMKLAAALVLILTSLSATSLASAQTGLLNIPSLQAPTAKNTPAPNEPAKKPTAAKPVAPKVASLSPRSPLQDPGAVFAGLTGWCWQAELAGGNTDTHCFTSAFNGKLVMDVHKVRNISQAVVYEGVTVYRPDRATRSLSYEYSNSFGDLITGQAWRTNTEINFSSQSGVLVKPETVWRIAGEGYDVPQADPKAPKLHFKRTVTANAQGL
jgi:hypothetical protein